MGKSHNTRGVTLGTGIYQNSVETVSGSNRSESQLFLLTALSVSWALWQESHGHRGCSRELPAGGSSPVVFISLLRGQVSCLDSIHL